MTLKRVPNTKEFVIPNAGGDLQYVGVGFLSH
jgi:hypothetical protein